MFVGKAGAYPRVEHLNVSPLLEKALGLTCKLWTRMDLARDEHSRLLRKSVSYGRKKFYRIGPGFVAQ